MFCGRRSYEDVYVCGLAFGMQFLRDAAERHNALPRLGKMATTTVQDSEEYIEQNNIQAILKECIAKICQDRPANPYKWFREHFERLERVGWEMGQIFKVKVNSGNLA